MEHIKYFAGKREEGIKAIRVDFHEGKTGTERKLDNIYVVYPSEVLTIESGQIHDKPYTLIRIHNSTGYISVFVDGHVDDWAKKLGYIRDV